MTGHVDARVIVIGAGPCGLTVAIELGRRGIRTIVLEEKTSPVRFPQANATQARTMEHYRRLGLAVRYVWVRVFTAPPGPASGWRHPICRCR